MVGFLNRRSHLRQIRSLGFGIETVSMNDRSSCWRLQVCKLNDLVAREQRGRSPMYIQDRSK